MTTKDDVKKLLEETEAKIRDPETGGTEYTLIILDFADQMSIKLPKLFLEYERLEKDLASSRSYVRWLDKQYHEACDSAKRVVR